MGEMSTETGSIQVHQDNSVEPWSGMRNAMIYEKNYQDKLFTGIL